MPHVEIGQPLPTMDSFGDSVRAAKFWRLSFRGGRKLIEGQDASGNNVLVQHPKELSDSYQSRLKLATAFNYTKPIINRYNDLVFNKAPAREIEFLDNFVDDVTGFGTDLDAFMRSLLKCAQVDGRSYILLDTVAVNTDNSVFGQINRLQAEAMGLRTVFRKIKIDEVPWAVVMDDQVVHAIIILRDANGVFAWEVTPSQQRRIDVNEETAAVLDIGEWENHQYGGCPLVMLRPTEEDSQASDIAEIQKAILNMNSLLQEELFGSTFTQWAAIGASVTDIEGLAKGVNRLLAINKQGVTLQSLSSDASQAASIRETIQDYIQEIYRTAGVTTGNSIESGPQISGIALAFLSQGMVTQAKALSQATMKAEQLAFKRLISNEGMSEEYKVTYNSDFSASEVSSIETVIKVVESSMPRAIKEAMVKAFAESELDLTDEQQARLEAELMAGETEPVSDEAGSEEIVEDV